MGDILQLSLRPKRFSETVGQKEIIESIRAQVASKRVPRTWMFIGASGGGKTTLARIMAMSLQCAHQEQFGEPCDQCLAKATNFSVVEINASDVNGIDEIRQVASTAMYQPAPPSRYRVYILDEAHNLSSASQNLLLKPFEDCPKTTAWFICTTNPSKILPTLKRRCAIYNVKPLGPIGVEKLIKRAAKSVGFQKDLDPFIEHIHTFGITSPGVILQSLEKYIAGAGAKEAVSTGDAVAAVALRICQSLTRGDWAAVKSELKRASPDQTFDIRRAVVGYLRAILLNDSGKIAAQSAAAIEELTAMGPVEEGLFAAWLFSMLYKNCKRFTA
jgi:DNA polymerase III delta prime subunit